MTDAMLGIVLGAVFVTGAYGVWTWQSFSRKVREYNDLAADYDEIMRIWLATHRENLDLRERLRIGDDEGER